ncbi:HAD family hydrolase [Ensifer sp. NPDC090286]|uniref:HAD family hydrolase n=1 Tax=Ensifer sp. NPDC090286 TaxID=3363991 RepID=UPI003839F5DE
MTFRFSGVILDLDGLLLDTERLQFEVGPAVLHGMGFDLAPDFFRKLVGVDRVESARLIGLEIGASIDSADLDRAWNVAMDKRMRDSIPLRPGVHDFLDALDKRKLPRAVATNSVTARAEWKLDHSGLLDRIDAVVGVDMVKRGKPAPDVYVAAAEKLRLAPSDCIALDDSDLGVRAALSAGIPKVIQVPDLVMSRDLLAHHQANSLSEARNILGI